MSRSDAETLAAIIRKDWPDVEVSIYEDTEYNEGWLCDVEGPARDISAIANKFHTTTTRKLQQMTATHLLFHWEKP